MFCEGEYGDPEPVIPFESSHNYQIKGQRLEQVANFRDLGGLQISNSNRVVKPLTIFRSAAPTYASTEDKNLLLETLDITTLIDFRTTYETKHINVGRQKFEDNFLTYSLKTDGNALIDHLDTEKMGCVMEAQEHPTGWRRLYRPPSQGLRRQSNAGIQRKRYALPLINNVYFFEGLYPTAPVSVKMKCTAVRYLMWSDKVGAYFLLKHLNTMGLFEMYRLTVEHTKREILTIFRFFKNPDNYPIHIFCSLGKDRTGVITALLLSCLGVKKELIIEDFHETEIHLQPNIPKIKRYFNRIGLTKEEFVMAPKHVMKQLLDYLDDKYGSVSKYLEDIGFRKDEQQLLFELMTSEKQTP